MARALPIPFVRRALGLSLAGAVLSVCVSGCIIPAPIEEEIPEEDLPPFVDQLTSIDPHLGVVRVDITNGDRFSFYFGNVQDPNEDQVLYWRAVVEYGNLALADTPKEISPEARLLEQQYLYDPCSDAHVALRQISAVDDYLLFIGISDSPFVNTGNNFGGERRIEDALETEGENEPLVIVWGLELEGTCPFRP